MVVKKIIKKISLLTLLASTATKAFAANVADNGPFNNDVTHNEDVAYTGDNPTFNSTAVFNGAATFQRNATFNGAATFQRNATFNGNLIFQGNFTFSNNVTLLGDLNLGVNHLTAKFVFAAQQSKLTIQKDNFDFKAGVGIVNTLTEEQKAGLMIESNQPNLKFSYDGGVLNHLTVIPKVNMTHHDSALTVSGSFLNFKYGVNANKIILNQTAEGNMFNLSGVAGPRDLTLEANGLRQDFKNWFLFNEADHVTINFSGSNNEQNSLYFVYHNGTEFVYRSSVTLNFQENDNINNNFTFGNMVVVNFTGNGNERNNFTLGSRSIVNFTGNGNNDNTLTLGNRSTVKLNAGNEGNRFDLSGVGGATNLTLNASDLGQDFENLFLFNDPTNNPVTIGFTGSNNAQNSLFFGYYDGTQYFHRNSVILNFQRDDNIGNTLTLGDNARVNFTGNGNNDNILTLGNNAGVNFTGDGNNNNTLTLGDGAGVHFTGVGNNNNTLTLGDGAGVHFIGAGNSNNNLTFGNDATVTLNAGNERNTFDLSGVAAATNLMLEANGLGQDFENLFLFNDQANLVTIGFTGSNNEQNSLRFERENAGVYFYRNNIMFNFTGDDNINNTLTLGSSSTVTFTGNNNTNNDFTLRDNSRLVLGHVSNKGNNVTYSHNNDPQFRFEGLGSSVRAGRVSANNWFLTEDVEAGKLIIYHDKKLECKDYRATPNVDRVLNLSNGELELYDKAKLELHGGSNLQNVKIKFPQDGDVSIKVTKNDTISYRDSLELNTATLWSNAAQDIVNQATKAKPIKIKLYRANIHNEANLRGFIKNNSGRLTSQAEINSALLAEQIDLSKLVLGENFIIETDNNFNYKGNLFFTLIRNIKKGTATGLNGRVIKAQDFSDDRQVSFVFQESVSNERTGGVDLKLIIFNPEIERSIDSLKAEKENLNLSDEERELAEKSAALLEKARSSANETDQKPDSSHKDEQLFSNIYSLNSEQEILEQTKRIVATDSSTAPLSDFTLDISHSNRIIFNNLSPMRLGMRDTQIFASAGNGKAKEIESWSMVSLAGGKKLEANNINPYNQSSYGFALGAHKLLNSDDLMGVALIYNTRNFKFKKLSEGDSAKVSNFILYLYASQNHGSAFFSEEKIFVSNMRNQAQYINKLSPGFSKYYYTDYDQMLYGGNVTFGYDHKINFSSVITPKIGFDFLHINGVSFEETGSLANRTINLPSYDSLFVNLGVKLYHSVEKGDILFSPFFGVDVKYNTKPKMEGTTFDIGDMVGMKMTSYKFDSTTTDVELGFDIKSSATMSIESRYVYSSSKNYSSHLGSVRLKVEM